MQNRIPAFLTIALILLSASLGSVYACRIIMPGPPHPHPRPGPQPTPRQVTLREMEVRSHTAHIDIDGRVAHTQVSAVFHNPNNQRIEGTYFFPINPGAAVSSFAMTVNGKTMEAELLEADKARGIYEDIVRSARDPALLEYVGQGMLKARVFPIEPRSDVAVELSYDQGVDRDSGMARVPYPLLSAKPGGENRVKTLLIDVRLKTNTSLKTVFTPGFKSSIDRDGRSARITFEANDYLPDRDFEVVFGEGKDKIGIDWVSYKKGDDGYFMLFIAPNSELQAEEIHAKDITFVVDTSGSMSGDKIRQAKQALRFCVNNLSEEDVFNIVAFSTDLNPLDDRSLPVTDANRRRALDFIDDLRARGGTAIDDAVAFALKAPSGNDMVPLVVFLTDGLPTIGEVEPDAILKRFREQTQRRFFTFGVGNDVNTKLLNGIAERTRGYPTYVRPEENLELALSSFYEKVASPVMTALGIDSGRVRLTEMSPPRLPDLFKGSQQVVTGRFRGKDEARMTLSGAVGKAREKFTFTADLDGDVRNAFIPRIWATARVAYLQEQIQLHGENGELLDEIKRLGREYGILTPYTSMLVVEDGVEREQLSRARRSFERFSAATRRAETGADAVDAAREVRSMKMAPARAMGIGGAADFAAPAGPGAQGVIGGGFWARKAREELDLSDQEFDRLITQVHDKTFYLRQRDGYLYDSAIPAGEFPEPDVAVQAWSDEFFELLVTHPDLRHYLKAGTKLVLKLDGQVIKISE